MSAQGAYLKHLPVVGVVLRAEVQEGQDAGRPDVSYWHAWLGEGRQGRALLGGVLAAVGILGLELQEPAWVT